MWVSETAVCAGLHIAPLLIIRFAIGNWEALTVLFTGHLDSGFAGRTHLSTEQRMTLQYIHYTCRIFLYNANTKRRHGTMV